MSTYSLWKEVDIGQEALNGGSVVARLTLLHVAPSFATYFQCQLQGKEQDMGELTMLDLLCEL